MTIPICVHQSSFPFFLFKNLIFNFISWLCGIYLIIDENIVLNTFLGLYVTVFLVMLLCGVVAFKIYYHRYFIFYSFFNIDWTATYWCFLVFCILFKCFINCHHYCKELKFLINGVAICSFIASAILINYLLLLQQFFLPILLEGF